MSSETPAVSDGEICDKCGAFGLMPHIWVEGMCVLPHRNHSRATVGFCCTWCVDKLAGWLTEIVELYAGLPDVLEPGSIPDTTAEHQRPKKRPASPAPVRLEAWAMLYDSDRLYRTGSPSDLPDVAAVLGTHAQALWDDLGYGPAPDTVTGAVGTLTANVEVVAGSPWIDEFDADLRWLRKALRDAHGITEPKPIGDCLTVDCTGKVWPDRDDGRPRCGSCKRRYGLHDLVRLKVNERATA